MSAARSGAAQRAARKALRELQISLSSFQNRFISFYSYLPECFIPGFLYYIVIYFCAMLVY